MIPGIGRLDAGFINAGGGFEAVVGVSNYAQRRDQLLAIYRQAHFAPRGLYVINPLSEVGAPTLPEGVEMTMELRQRIAAARVEAGKPVPRIGETNDSDFIDDPELDGIVEKPDWVTIGEHIESLMSPGIVVLPRELPCPDAETAVRLNHEFWEMVKNTPEVACRIVGDAASAWVQGASKALAMFPPQVRADLPVLWEPFATATATFTQSELRGLGETLRNRLMDTAGAKLVEALDRSFVQAFAPDAGAADAERGHVDLFPGDAVRRLKAWGFDAPIDTILLTPEVSEALAIPFGQPLDIAGASAVFAPTAHPFPAACLIGFRSLGEPPEICEPLVGASIRYVEFTGEVTITLSLYYKPAKPQPGSMVLYRIVP